MTLSASRHFFHISILWKLKGSLSKDRHHWSVTVTRTGLDCIQFADSYHIEAKEQSPMESLHVFDTFTLLFALICLPAAAASASLPPCASTRNSSLSFCSGAAGASVWSRGTRARRLSMASGQSGRPCLLARAAVRAESPIESASATTRGRDVHNNRLRNCGNKCFAFLLRFI